eukprot:TRINITY_DN881_c0_g1_i2.p1 TRINITY_DN881_c0_g1~~TRINITY_DN881_c0_g1_i2.p1  ORF type:complete len:320 (+),score=52.15 TRINITY_DN881_c0_g1_i2:813-1772(+)
MIFKVNIRSGKKSVMVSYDTVHHTGSEFMEELEIIFKRQGVYLKNNEQPLLPNRLQSMMLMAGEQGKLFDVFKGFSIKNEGGAEILQLDLGVNVSDDAAPEQMMRTQVKPEKKLQLSTLAKLKAPRVCSEDMSKTLGLPLGAFITPTTSKYLTSPQKKIWQRECESIISQSEQAQRLGEACASRTLSKYYSQSNQQIAAAKQSRDWRTGSTKHFFDAYEKWFNTYSSEFLGVEDDNNDEEEEEVIPEESEVSRVTQEVETLEAEEDIGLLDEAGDEEELLTFSSIARRGESGRGGTRGRRIKGKRSGEPLAKSKKKRGY